MSRRLLAGSLVGAAVTALCCVTPLLPVVLGAVGAGALIGPLYRDIVLLPLLVLFLVPIAVAIWRRKRS